MQENWSRQNNKQLDYKPELENGPLCWASLCSSHFFICYQIQMLLKLSHRIQAGNSFKSLYQVCTPLQPCTRAPALNQRTWPTFLSLDLKYHKEGDQNIKKNTQTQLQLPNIVAITHCNSMKAGECSTVPMRAHLQLAPMHVENNISCKEISRQPGARHHSCHAKRPAGHPCQRRRRPRPGPLPSQRSPNLHLFLHSLWAPSGAACMSLSTQPLLKVKRSLCAPSPLPPFPVTN